jgi:putative transposase
MNKRLRVEYAGAIYHVIQRGNNQEFVFDRAQDKWFLLSSLEQVTQFYEADMIAYVIMGNHYHLVVRTWETGLGQVMHRLNTKFSVYYNQDKERSGHVFQGRYQANLIKDDSHLLTAVRYVHQNPVRAGICRRVEDYRWSSDGFYRGQQQGFVKKDMLLSLLATNHNEASNEYARLMEITEPADVYDYQISPQSHAINLHPQDSPEGAVNQGMSLDDILLAAARDVEWFQLIKEGSRKRELTRLKSIYVATAIKQGYPIQKIADNIKISKVAVSKLQQKTSGG